MKKPASRKAETALLTPVQCNKLVARYAKMRGVPIEQARCMLIASGWRRLAALARYGAK